MLYPPTGRVYGLPIKLNRIYILTKLDLKQLFKKAYEKEPDNGYITIAGIKTKINAVVQDLKSLITSHNLGTYDVYEDYTFRVKWSKTVIFNSSDNTNALKQWFKAIGLAVDTTYATQTMTTIPIDQILVQSPFVISLVTSNNNSIFPVYGKSSAQLTLGQFIVYTPIGFEIEFYGDKTVSEFEIEQKEPHFHLQLYHKASGTNAFE